MYIFRRPKYHIEFITSDWAARKHFPIKPAKELLPPHWKSMSSESAGQDTVRKCPGIGDWLTTGYIIPAWTDIVIHQHPEYGPSASLNNGNTGAANHPPYQCLTLLADKSHYHGTIKLPGVWKIKTAPGWSIMTVPLWYYQNQPWEALPGIIHSDYHHGEVNINFTLKSKEETISIPAGTPLVQIIPFKRVDINAVSRAATNEDLNRHKLMLKLYHWTKNGITKFYKKKTNYRLDVKDTDFEESLKYPLED